jgi:hypothetical protein
MAIDDDRRPPFSFKCDEALHHDLAIAASLDGCSKADIARRALLQFMRRRKREAFDEHPRRRPISQR